MKLDLKEILSSIAIICFLLVVFDFIFDNGKGVKKLLNSNQGPIPEIPEAETQITESKAKKSVSKADFGIAGKYYEEDKMGENLLIKDIEYDYRKDGTFTSTGILITETNEFFFTINGNWMVKNKYLYHSSIRVKSDSKFYADFMEELYNKKNGAYRIIEYNPQRLLLESPEGTVNKLIKRY
jgi:hypothetical protein